MGRFLLGRLVSIIPVLIGIVFVTFVLVRAIPGDPCRAIPRESATTESCNRFKERFNLNDNVIVQFTSYAGNLATGSLGDSIKFGRPVGEILLERLPMTPELTIGALIFAIVFGIP